MAQLARLNLQPVVWQNNKKFEFASFFSKWQQQTRNSYFPRNSHCLPSSFTSCKSTSDNIRQNLNTNETLQNDENVLCYRFYGSNMPDCTQIFHNSLKAVFP